MQKCFRVDKIRFSRKSCECDEKNRRECDWREHIVNAVTAEVNDALSWCAR